MFFARWLNRHLNGCFNNAINSKHAVQTAAIRLLINKDFLLQGLSAQDVNIVSRKAMLK